MGVKWTPDQQKVIDLRDRNILVSAAAGSGKTAVLVERIMGIVCDEAHPVDVDRLLVVTFTKAAAAEMKERIGAAIRLRLKEQPNNGYLQRQETLVHHAQITTIDSFCSYILRNHFGEIDLDPAFRVADEGELKLLKKDVLKELLEEEYEKKRPEFLHFVECYASGKNDAVLEELILKLYEFSTSAPFPQEWLEQLLEEADISLENELPDHVKKLLESLLEENRNAAVLCTEPGGPYLYEEALLSDRQLLQKCLEAETYGVLSAVIRERSYQRLSTKKMSGEVEESKKNAVKAAREHMKKSLDNLEKQYFFMSEELILEAEDLAKPVKKELVELTLSFLQRFAEKKKKRNIVDFSDMEHFALQILVEKKDGICVPTDVAKAYGEHFAEIMIDEYQDSNLVQELILTSISKQSLGGNNLFMVGDVKQSIYRFRQARPELFMEKQERYTLTDSASQRVNLSMNFRSRKEVLDAVNFLFERMMIKELGNVAYDELAALNLGAKMPEPEKQEDVTAELLILDIPKEGTQEELNSTELEAAMVAERILQILKETKVTDKESGCLRNAKPGDIVILLRTMSGWSDVFSNVLASYGIQTVTGSSTGYFSSPEIQTMLNFLSVLDNRKQDLPLAAVLHSPIGNLSSREMAQIRAQYREEAFHEACLRYAKDGNEETLRRKISEFWQLVDLLRKKAEYLPIHKLIWEIYDKTAYEQLVRLSPNGEVRKANLQMLVQKALDYESTSYRGLFNFVRYIENLQKYEVDYGVAESAAGNDNAVRIMSIHKSKGLEFPIVFVSGLAKSFNKQDVRARMALHPDYGIGIEAIDPKRRIKISTLKKKVIQKQVELEGLGEELRVLYVALTRAKEKLLMTGVLKNAEEAIQKASEESALCTRGTYEGLCAGSSFLDWILQVSAAERPPFEQKIVSLEELVHRKVQAVLTQTYDYERLYGKAVEIPKELEEKFSYVYPYRAEEELPSKVSVSELKMAAMEEDVRELFETPQIIPYIPAFLREERTLGAAERGTAYHRVMECMDFSGIENTADVKSRMKQLVQEGKLTQTAADSVNAKDIFEFSRTELCRRMLAAKEKGLLFMEQPFVIAKPACEIYEGETESTQPILIQGIIDACFEEEDGIVLLDYKTDYIKTGGELIRRYKKQLQLYAQALEQTTGKKVKENMMYSFCLKKEISI